jgi:hypothetical protein
MDKSRGELENEYLEAFGADGGRAVQIVTNSVCQLYQEWRLFLYFFAGPKERVGVLNDASGLTARTLQNTLWDSALIKVRRLTDPSKQRSNENLSLERLVGIAQESCKIDLKPAYAELIEKVSHCRKYTDKNLVHRDLRNALSVQKQTIDLRTTTDAIRKIGWFVRKFHSLTRDVDYLLMPIAGADDEQRFLLRLHLGNEAALESQKESYQKVQAGDFAALMKPECPDWIYAKKSKSPSFDFE